MAIKILLDTDIGSDIDDALCLAYLLAHPECELLGITTVSGRGTQRAKLASALCLSAGRQVPIAIGAEAPLLATQLQPDVPQATALGDWASDATEPTEPAVDLMRRTIHANPGEVVLLGIGPMTNIALLFAIDPAIPGILKGLVSMAGVFESRPRCEWNVKCDPHAAAMVYRTRVSSHTSVGLNVTTSVAMEPEDLRRRLTAPTLQPLRSMAEIWLRAHDSVVFHDPLAAAAVFGDELFQFATGSVAVEPTPGPQACEIRWSRDVIDGHHRVAVAVDSDAFFEHYFSVIDRLI